MTSALRDSGSSRSTTTSPRAAAPSLYSGIQLRRPILSEPISPTFVVLSVADDGSGMDPDTQMRMCEPYFTRKSAGHGLGLSTVYGIVKRCEGTILVESAPGEGTTLRVALPLTSSSA